MPSAVALDEALSRPRLYTVAEAATALRVSPSHLYEQIARGRVAGVVRIGRVIRVNLDAFLDATTQGTST